MNEKRAMTALGPVDADELSTTLTHEHLLFDQIEYVRGPVDADSAMYEDAKGRCATSVNCGAGRL